MRRELPIVAASISGIVILAAYFFNVQGLSLAATDLQNWGIVISAFALVVSSLNLLMLHLRSVVSGKKVFNSAALIISFVLIVLCGLTGTGTSSPQFRFVFDNLFVPLGVTFYAMNVFYLASASYRAFRAKSFEALLLLLAGVIIMLGNAPAAEFVTNGFVKLSAWIMKVPNVAATRGILIGSAIGTILTGMRIILGLDRSYLGIDN